MKSFRRKKDLALEEFLSDDWVRDLGVAEKPLSGRVLFLLNLGLLALGAVVLFRVFFLGLNQDFFKARAEANLNQIQKIAAPRGIIYDSKGEILADNRPVFLALLNVREFFKRKDLEGETLRVAEEVLGIPKDDFWELVRDNDLGVFQESIVLNQDLEQSQLIQIESLNLPTVFVSRGFSRRYSDGPVFAHVLGYTGIVSKDDLRRFPNLGGRDFVGKSGVEAFYETRLQGLPGRSVKFRDAQGNILEEKAQEEPEIGDDLYLTIDAEFQRYFYNRMKQGLYDLGRSIGAGLVLDPRSGQILAMVSFPSFDNNLFFNPKNSREIFKLLNSPDKPMFNRTIGGLYAPGSTIKPLHALAALSLGVISPDREVFSPGFLDVPNPYDPDNPTRFLDWKYHGRVNLTSAIARSSNVYFYLVGGGSPPGISGEAATYNGGIRGLGIGRLREWWQKFRLDLKTGVDLYGEVGGFLPSPESKSKKTGTPWLLGDTYNVSIGQGELLVSPLELLSYITAIGNGGKIYKPYLARDLNSPQVLEDFSNLKPLISKIDKAMVEVIQSPNGSAYVMHDLPFRVAGKTGSAQVKNNTQQNAFFVGYASFNRSEQNQSYSEPEVAILVLVENAKEGSLNAIPIAKDVLNWYYLNRTQK